MRPKKKKKKINGNMIKIKALLRSKDRDSLPWTQAQCSAWLEGSVAGMEQPVWV